MKRFSALFFPLAVFALAFCIRLLYLFEIRKSPFFSFPLIDAETYFEMAQNIAGGDLLAGHAAYWQPPLYPYLLALGLALFGQNHFLLHLLHFLLGSLNCVLIYSLGRRVFSEGIAKLAGLIAALYGPFLYFEGEYLAPVLLVFLSLLVLLALLRAGEKASARAWFLPGFLLGLHAIARPDILLFLPPALAWLIARHWRRMKAASLTLAAGLFLLGLILPILPVSLRNWAVERVVVPISSNGGLNFYIGNNPDYDRMVGIRPGYTWLDLNQRPFLDRVASTAERSDYFYRLSFRWIREHPGDWLGLMARKTGMFWMGHEFVRNLNFYSFRQYSRVLSLLLWEHGIAFPFGLIAPFALLGLVLSLRDRRPQASLLILFTLASSFSVIFFFIASRYRVPLVPVLLLLALRAGQELAASRRRRQWRIFAPGLLALGGLLFFLNRGTHMRMEVNPAEELYWLGKVAWKQGNRTLAQNYFDQALRLDPSHLESRMQSGFLALETMRWPEAEHHFQQVLRGQGQVPLLARAVAHASLGQIARETGKPEPAEAEFRAALAIAPGFQDARMGLAKLLIEENRLEEAEADLRQAIRFGPWSAEAYLGLGLVYLRRGQNREALPWLEEAVRCDPQYVDARIALAETYWNLGFVQEAQREARRILAQDPQNPEAGSLLDFIEQKERSSRPMPQAPRHE